MSQTPFSINPALDPQELARGFAKSGRIHVPDFLTPACAEAISSHMRGRQDWRLVVNQGEKLFELDRDAQKALAPNAAAKLDEAVYLGARTGFQYRYETIRVPDEDRARKAGASLLNDFAGFMSSPTTLEFLRTVIGSKQIRFADAQATAYGPGHFLTAHDDAVGGKHRLAAYVFNLSREWRADWGGLLAFHGATGHIEEAFAPRFNALNLFSVPQPHSVTYVTPFVPYRRYAITGWLRSELPSSPK
jgi:Rps23 Pro-64 3,4-dihydroxylase Tpa1-like proline 4-hydroxylase